MDKGVSIKLKKEFRTFIKDFARNRIISRTDLEKLSQPDACNLIVKYFKLNNDRYLELIKLQPNKNVQ